MAGTKLFDDYNSDEEEYETEESEDGPTDVDTIRQMLMESKIDIEEEDQDKEYDTYFILSSGVLMGFDESGKLIAVKKT